ncbi:2228_t:CDS:2 [Paraglomus brasilianum]|uniref:2228_t:CDS:1 n=1 Tax=Paraglomus brasilianum TaxID=144538 RepID=A0A9N9B611_9GLOM|nr:2228_t:CDS:2 [Paraglomus brasilianum]
MTLKEIRKKLFAYENDQCIMKDYMFFCDKNCARIRKSDEGKFYLYEILKENVICITRCKTLEEVMPHLIEKRKLNCGIRLTEDGPTQSDNVAFKFESYNNNVVEDSSEYNQRTFEQSNNYRRSELCKNGIEWKLDLNMLWPFISSIGVHFTNERSNESSENHRKCRNVQRYCRAKLFMKGEHIEPSDNFKNEVEDAVSLSLEERRIKLKEICEKYGYFWARRVQLGGMVIQTEEESESTNIQSVRRRRGIDIDMGTGPLETGSGISQNNGRLNQISSSNTNRNITVIGGDVAVYIHPGDTRKWQETLQDRSTWEIIHYEDIVPIYEIFEERIQIAIRKAFSVVCFSGIDILDLQEKNFLIRPIRFPPNVWEGIRQHQIFIEVMYEGKHDTIFAANIEQTDGLPNVHVSKIQKAGNSILGKKSHKLKLAYIITGYPQSSDFQIVDESSVKVDVVQGKKKDDKFVASLPNIQDFNQGAVLITCYITQLMQQTGSRSQRDSDDSIVFTMHLHKPDDTKPTEVCIFGKNLIYCLLSVV